MKRLLLPILLLVSVSSYAQTSVSNFQVENNSLIYRRVFEVEADEAGLMRQLMTTEGLGEVKANNGIVTANIDGMKVDYKKHGGSWGSTPGVLNFPLYGNLIAEFKDGRYRVTLSNLKFQSDPNSNPTEFSFYAINKKNEFRTNKNSLAILFYSDKHFTDAFTLKEVAASEDW